MRWPQGKDFRFLKDVRSLVGLSVLAFLGLTWLVKWFLTGRSSAWAPAIQSAATITLVIVTASYVLLTRNLVSVQLKSPRIAGQEQAARDLYQLLKTDTSVGTAVRKFPLQLDDPKKIADNFTDTIDDLRNLATSIDSYFALLPTQCAGLCREASNLLRDTEKVWLSVLITCLGQRFENIDTGESWDPAKARARWYVETRPKMEDKPEWDDAVSGKKLLLAKDRIANLETSLVDFLRT